MMDMETGCEKWDEVALEEVEEKDYELEKNRI